MTKEITAERSQQITEQLAQLYVDAKTVEMEERYWAITGGALEPLQAYKVKSAALDEFNSWLRRQGGGDHGA